MRVLVLRPAEAAARTASRLAALGHEAILAPVLAIVPTGAPAPSGPFDALVLTSANAAAAAATLDRAIPVFAVGDRTAATALRAGFATVADARGGALDLARLVEAHRPPPARLLLAAGRDRKAEPERSLRAAGYALETWIVYAAEPAPALPDPARMALAYGRVGAALHYSRRSAAAFLDQARRMGLGPVASALRHLCLSSDVAAGLTDCPAIEVASRPDEDALLDLLGR